MVQGRTKCVNYKTSLPLPIVKHVVNPLLTTFQALSRSSNLETTMLTIFTTTSYIYTVNTLRTNPSDPRGGVELGNSATPLTWMKCSGLWRSLYPMLGSSPKDHYTSFTAKRVTEFPRPHYSPWILGLSVKCLLCIWMTLLQRWSTLLFLGLKKGSKPETLSTKDWQNRASLLQDWS